MLRAVRAAVALVAAAVVLLSGAAVAAVAVPEPGPWELTLRVPLCRFESSAQGTQTRVEFHVRARNLAIGSTLAGRGVLRLDDAQTGRQFDVGEVQASDDGTLSMAQELVILTPETLPGTAVVELAVAGHDAQGDVFVTSVEERAACSRGE